jgi:hypothetical protein
MCQMQHFTNFLLTFTYDLLVKRIYSLFNSALTMAILDLNLRVHLAQSGITLPK